MATSKIVADAKALVKELLIWESLATKSTVRFTPINSSAKL